MPPIILFVSTGLLIYWISRVKVLRQATAGEIRETLENDWLRGRRFVLWLRSVCLPAVQLAE